MPPVNDPRKYPLITFLWTTAITISYLKLHASSHETIWKVQYEKARKYLSVQIKNVELEEELLKATSKLVEEKTTKKVSETSGVTSTIGTTLGSILRKYD